MPAAGNADAARRTKGCRRRPGPAQNRSTVPGVAAAHLADRPRGRRPCRRRERHVVLVPVAPDPHFEVARKRVDHGNPDAVEPARETVAVERELPAGVQPGQDHLYAGKPSSGWRSTGIPRPSSATQSDPSRCRVTSMRRANPRERLVHAVVHHFMRECVGGRGVGVQSRAACGPAPGRPAPRSRWRRTFRPWRSRTDFPIAAILRRAGRYPHRTDAMRCLRNRPVSRSYDAGCRTGRSTGSKRESEPAGSLIASSSSSNLAGSSSRPDDRHARFPDHPRRASSRPSPSSRPWWRRWNGAISASRTR